MTSKARQDACWISWNFRGMSDACVSTRASVRSSRPAAIRSASRFTQRRWAGGDTTINICRRFEAASPANDLNNANRQIGQDQILGGNLRVERCRVVDGIEVDLLVLRKIEDRKFLQR